MRLPKHLNMTDRQFKAWKRAQFNSLCSYIETLDIQLASAYLPKDQFNILSEAIEMIYEARKQLRLGGRRHRG